MGEICKIMNIKINAISESLKKMNENNIKTAMNLIDSYNNN